LDYQGSGAVLMVRQKFLALDDKSDLAKLIELLPPLDKKKPLLGRRPG